MKRLVFLMALLFIVGCAEEKKGEIPRTTDPEKIKAEQERLRGMPGPGNK